MIRTHKLIWVLVCLLGAACSPSPPVAPATPRAEDSLLILTDPCAVRLGDIADALLMYYSQNRQLPQKLEELQTAAGGKALLDFTCPVTGQPYVYVPTNLNGPGADRRVLVYDAQPNAKGRRWGIVAAPSRPAHPVNM